MHAVGMDYAGPLKMAGPSGERNFAIIVDHATKWVWAYPTVGQTAADSFEVLQRYFTERNCFPQQIFTDRGSFTAMEGEWSQFLRRFSVTSKRTLSLNPQADGHSEAQVKNVTLLLKKAVQEHPDCWVEALRWAVFAYNLSFNRVIGTTPFYAVHGERDGA